MFNILKSVNGKSVVFYNFEELCTYTDVAVGMDTENFFDLVLAQHILNSEKRESKLNDLAFDYSTKILDEKVSPNQLELIMDVLGDSYIAQLEKMNSLELYPYTQQKIKDCLNVKEDLLP